MRQQKKLCSSSANNKLDFFQSVSVLQERLQELEGHMALKEKELQRLKAELGAIDSDRARTEEEKKRMRAAFEEKAEAVQRQMLQLQKQLKDGEAAKVSLGIEHQLA